MGALSKPVGDLFTRLGAHAVPAGILAGFRIESVSRTSADGVDDLPRVTGVGIRADDETRSLQAGFAKLSVRLSVSSKKEPGLAAHLADLERVMDAVETNASGEWDATLESGTIKGVSFSGDETETTGVSISTLVTVTVETVPFNRGNRRGAS